MKSPMDAARRVQWLVNINQEGYADRDRIRRIMNGGREAASALLGRAPRNGELPLANMMLSGGERLGQKLGAIPDLRVDMPEDSDSMRARKAADKRERVASSYDEACTLDLQLPQMGRWLPGYGFCALVVKEKKGRDGYIYPHLTIRDPFDCYPSPWGVDQQPEDVAFLRRVPADELVARYPQLKALMTGDGMADGYGNWRASGAGGWQPGSQWENPQQIGVTVAEYFDADGCHMVLPEFHARLEFTPYLTDGPQFYIAKRFAFDKLQGQWGHIVGLMGAMAKLNLLSVVVMEDAANSETNVFGDVEGSYRRGRNVVNVLAPGTRVEKVATNLPYQYFQEIDRLERYARMATAYAVSDDGESPNSFVTGRGLEELKSGTNGNVRELRTVLRRALEWADSTRLELDERSNGDVRKPLSGVNRVTGAYSETYTPSRHINGNYRTRRAYGAMAGWDDSAKIVAGLQLLQANVISTQSLQENVDGLENITREQERIRNERAEAAVYQALLARANEGDPVALEATIALLPDSELKKTLSDVFMPEEEEGAGGGMEDMLAQMMAQQQEQASLPAEPPPVSTVLQQLNSDGGSNAGVQTVGKLPGRIAAPVAG